MNVPFVTRGEAGTLVLPVRLGMVALALGIVEITLGVRLGEEEEEEVVSVPLPYAEGLGLDDVELVVIPSLEAVGL